MGPSFIRSCAGDRCTTGNSPTLTRRLNLKWNYSLDGWLLRQAWQQRIKNIDNLPNEILTCHRVFLFTAYLFPTSVASKQDFNASGCWIFKDASLTLLLTFARSADDQWWVGRSGGNITSEGMHYSYVTYDKEVSFSAGLNNINKKNHFLSEVGLNHQSRTRPVRPEWPVYPRTCPRERPFVSIRAERNLQDVTLERGVARAGCFWHLSRWWSGSSGTNGGTRNAVGATYRGGVEMSAGTVRHSEWRTLHSRKRSPEIQTRLQMHNYRYG